METTIYDLKLHESIIINKGENFSINCLRVPGGWIYEYSDFQPVENEWFISSTVFIPFHNEFQKEEESHF